MNVFQQVDIRGMARSSTPRFGERDRTTPAERDQLGHRSVADGHGESFAALHATQDGAHGVPQLAHGQGTAAPADQGDPTSRSR
jgi:hypothetical protein